MASQSESAATNPWVFFFQKHKLVFIASSPRKILMALCTLLVQYWIEARFSWLVACTALCLPPPTQTNIRGDSFAAKWR